MCEERKTAERHLDARTFQQPLNDLAITLVFKVQREGPRLLPTPQFVIPDIYYLIRQCHQTCNLLFFLNAEERRKKDPDWVIAYSAASLPLIRTMIDCLYNITAILGNPASKGEQFRVSGYKNVLETLDADEKRYGGDHKWDEWIAEQRKMIGFDMRLNGFTEAQVRATKSWWPTLSRYLKVKEDTPVTPHQEFLKKLTLGFWQEYSALSHAMFQGLTTIGVFLAPKDLPHEHRPMVEDRGEIMIGQHVPRAAAILLCTLTEVQAYFRFDLEGVARINQRLHQIWNALLPVPEIKELYDERYGKLMQDKGINPG
jgi:hypothetical protein